MPKERCLHLPPLKLVNPEQINTEEYMKSVVLLSQEGNPRCRDHVVRPHSQEEPGFQFPENATKEEEISGKRD